MPRTEVEIRSDEGGGQDAQRNFLRSLRDARGALYGCILALVPQRSDAEEVFQETVSVLWKEYQAHGPPANFSAWSNSIARNITRSFIRRERKRGRTFLGEAHLNQLSKVQAGSSELLELRHEMLRQCLAALSGKDRKFVLESYGADAPVSAQAREQGRSPEALYSRLKRLRHRLFECVNRRMSSGNP